MTSDLREIEKGRSADVLTAEKVERIFAGARPAEAGARRAVAEAHAPGARPRRRPARLPSEHKSAFDAYMRSGDEPALRSLDAKAMSYGSRRRMAAIWCRTRPRRKSASGSPCCRRSARLPSVRQVSSRGAEEAVLDHRAGRRLGGRDRGPAADGDGRRWPSCSFRRWSSTPCRRRPRRCWRTRVVDLDQWISGEVETAFAEQEGAAFVSGDGTNKPKGFLDYDKVAEASWTWGKIGYIVTGVAGALAGRAIRRTSDRHGLCAEGRLPAERQLGDEPQDPGARSASSRTPTATICGSRRRRPASAPC